MQNSPPVKVLICEDEELMLTALEYRLSKQGFKVLKAKDGAEAIRILIQNPPDAMVADILMPNVNGTKLTEYVRFELKSKLPIILISALEENDELVLQAIRAGANDFIAKPFKPAELVLRLRRILQDK